MPRVRNTPPAADPAVQNIAAIRLERKALEDLIPHPRNPRVHPEPGTPQWNALQASLAHDYFDPMVWNERNGKLVSGHFRKKVMRHNGVTHADVVVVSYDEPTHLARMIAANKAAGEDDEDALRVLFSELREEDGGMLALTAYDETELANLFPDLEDEQDEEDTGDSQEAQISPVGTNEFRQNIEAIHAPAIPVARGELWQCGEHLIACIDPVREGYRIAPLLDETRWLFIAPDPFCLVGWVYEDSYALILQPNAVVASYTVSAWASAHPDQPPVPVEWPETE